MGHSPHPESFDARTNRDRSSGKTPAPCPSTPRILLVSRNFPPLLGGMERLNQHLLQELERTYEVHLVGPAGAKDYVLHPERARTCPPRPVSAFLACAAVQGMRLGRQERPGLVIAGSGVNAPPAWLAAKASGARWMVYLHGLDLVASHLAYQRVFLPVIRRADAWLVNSHATARLADAAGLDGARVHLLHPGVEIPGTPACADQIRAWRDSRGFGERPLLLSVGRLTKRKGLREFVIHALPAILAAHPDTVLGVVGEEPHAALSAATVGVEMLREAARANGTDPSLRILGRLSDTQLGLAYRAATALVFPVLDTPDDIEGFGMVAIEAAAHGLPTVAFAVGGVPDAIAEGVSGYLIGPGDYASMASRLIALVSHGPGAGDRGHCMAFASRFAWPQFGTRLRGICQSVMASPKMLGRTAP